MLRRTLFVAAVFALTLEAQPLITVRPDAAQIRPGIEIVTPSDPSFQERLKTA